MPPSRELAILGACAVPHGHPRQRARLAKLLAGPVRWDELVTLAEEQNLTGLAWQHLHDLADLPADARLRLMGLRLRRRSLTHFQEEVTARVLDVAARAGVEVMLLKGAALRRLVYPDPELRAMRDIDLLAPEADGRRLQDALTDAGFAPVVRTTPPSPTPIHHPVLLWQQDGVAVGVEVHWVVHWKWQAGFEELAPRGTRIEVLGRVAWVPSRLDLLRHVFLHCFGGELWLSSRLVAIADLVAMLETWEETLDWRLLRGNDRALVRALAWLDLLAPLSDAALARVGKVGRSGGVGELYEGWPLDGGFLKTFTPSPWWLRLRFRARPGILPLAWAWARHVYNVLEVWW